MGVGGGGGGGGGGAGGIFMIGKNIGGGGGGGGGHRPCSDAHAILRSFSKSVMQTSCGQFMQFVGHECRLQHRRGATM